MSKRERTPSPSLTTSSGPSSPRPDSPTDREKLARTERKFSSPYPPAITCSEKPLCNSVPFNSYEAYEIHYLQAHTNRCMECRRNFPTEHFLGLHIHENHDPFFEIKVQRGEKCYGCFVEGCDKLCRNSLTRRNHLIAKHYFPKDYDWNIINSGIDRRQSLLAHGKVRNPKPRNTRPSASSAPSAPSESQPSETTKSSNADADVQMGDLSDKMAGLKMVPRKIRFGRG